MKFPLNKMCHELIMLWNEDDFSMFVLSTKLQKPQITGSKD